MTHGLPFRGVLIGADQVWWPEGGAMGGSVPISYWHMETIEDEREGSLHRWIYSPIPSFYETRLAHGWVLMNYERMEKCDRGHWHIVERWDRMFQSHSDDPTDPFAMPTDNQVDRFLERVKDVHVQHWPGDD